jgi:hypothetical protein
MRVIRGRRTKRNTNHVKDFYYSYSIELTDKCYLSNIGSVARTSESEVRHLYRAVDSHGDTLDFMLSERRDEDAATAFFKQAINNNGFPDRHKRKPHKE